MYFFMENALEKNISLFFEYAFFITLEYIYVSTN